MDMTVTSSQSTKQCQVI